MGVEAGKSGDLEEGLEFICTQLFLQQEFGGHEPRLLSCFPVPGLCLGVAPVKPTLSPASGVSTSYAQEEAESRPSCSLAGW